MTGKESPRLYFEVETSSETRGKTRKRGTMIIMLISILVIVMTTKIIHHSLA